MPVIIAEVFFLSMGHHFQETSEKCKHFQAFVPLGTGCIRKQQQKILQGLKRNAGQGILKPVTTNLVNKQEEELAK